MDVIRQLGRRSTLLLSVGFAGIVVRIISLLLLIQYPPGYDARSYIAAAQAIAGGVDPYSLQAPVEEFSKYLYPPFLALLFLPLAKLPMLTVSYLAIILSLLSAFLLVWALRPWVGWKLALVAVFAFAPTWHTIYLGQINLLIAALVALACQLFFQRRELAAGAALALGALVKITPVLLLGVWLRERAWRGVAGFALTCLAAFGISLLFVRPELWLTGSLAALRQSLSYWELVSWTGIVGTMLGRNAGPAVALITLLFAGLTLARAAVVPSPFAMGACILLPLLVARITWDHHMVMALPVLALIWQHAREYRAPIVVAWLVLALGHGVFLPMVVTLCWTCCCWPQLLPAYLAQRAARAAS